MYAVIETGGKQYNVSVGDVIYIEKLGVEADDDEVTVEVFAEEAKNDKVAEIMAQTESFTQIAEKEEAEKKEEASAKKNILDILSKASFAK